MYLLEWTKAAFTGAAARTAARPNAIIVVSAAIGGLNMGSYAMYVIRHKSQYTLLHLPLQSYYTHTTHTHTHTHTHAHTRARIKL